MPPPRPGTKAQGLKPGDGIGVPLPGRGPGSASRTASRRDERVEQIGDAEHGGEAEAVVDDRLPVVEDDVPALARYVEGGVGRLFADLDLLLGGAARRSSRAGCRRRTTEPSAARPIRARRRPRAGHAGVVGPGSTPPPGLAAARAEADSLASSSSAHAATRLTMASATMMDVSIRLNRYRDGTGGTGQLLERGTKCLGILGKASYSITAKEAPSNPRRSRRPRPPAPTGFAGTAPPTGSR